MNDPDTLRPALDLNADVGEMPERLRDGREAALLGQLSSANLACGGHAGDEATMTEVVRLCQKLGVAIGAHPSYPDRAGFGRHRMVMDREALVASLCTQLQTLSAITDKAGAELAHLKSHGALYHDAADDPAIAASVAEAVRRTGRRLVLVGRAGSRGLEVWREAGFPVAAEAFADRRYEADGSLRDRRLVGALLTDPAEVAEQGLELARGRVRTPAGWLSVIADTLCLHGDTPGSEHLAAALRRQLLAAGARIAPLRL
ncbi:MAG: 5-oxoprolinase subunit PxpA [Polyangia bacterium]